MSDNQDRKYLKYLIELSENQATRTNLLLTIAANDLREKHIDKAVAGILADHLIEKDRRETERENIQSQHYWLEERDRTMQKIKNMPESEKIQTARELLIVARRFQDDYVAEGSRNQLTKDGADYHKNEARKYVDSTTFAELYNQIFPKSK